jgi:hypothetical protein
MAMTAGLEGELQRRHVCQPASGYAMVECSVDECCRDSGVNQAVVALGVVICAGCGGVMIMVIYVLVLEVSACLEWNRHVKMGRSGRSAAKVGLAGWPW